jgi:hypothetical protein
MTTPLAPSSAHPADAEDGPQKTNIVKVVFASLIGTAVEWYDFFLYGSAAALVFGTLFFPDSEPATATMLAFGTYALASWRDPWAASSSGTSVTGSAARRCSSSRCC